MDLHIELRALMSITIFGTRLEYVVQGQMICDCQKTLAYFFLIREGYLLSSHFAGLEAFFTVHD